MFRLKGVVSSPLFVQTSNQKAVQSYLKPAIFNSPTWILNGIKKSTIRLFCSSEGGSGEGGEEAEGAIPEVNPVIIDKNEKGLTLQFGDHAPKINPLIILPIARRPIFPGFMSTHIVKDPKTIEAISQFTAKGATYLGLFLRKDNITDDVLRGDNGALQSTEHLTSLDQIHNVGTLAQVMQLVKNERGATLLLSVHRRISIDQITTYGPPAIGQVTHLPPPKVDPRSPMIKAYFNSVLMAAREIFRTNPASSESVNDWTNRMEFNDPAKLADFAVSITSADGEDLQKVLDSSSVEERLNVTLELLNQEREVIKLQKEISKQVDEKLSKQQREYFLREQLKAINKELGIEKDDRVELVEKYRALINEFKDRILPSNLKIINDEVNKLSTLERQSAEYNVIRAYLDWLTQIPWGKYSVDELNIAKASKILNEDHYGLDDIKKRILEFIAVSKVKGSASGKIICFIGPPGVGKTSIAKSIAASLGRQFYRFSVGGLTDIAEIKGHRRTYIGAMPGKPIQCLKNVGYANPLILIDEVDKIGRDHHGDPASALLELLDPNQNTAFVDHYLDIPVDFSHVLFVCTANDEGTIPGPLRDRMEIIRLSGYDIPEKIAIAKQHLLPKILKEIGVTAHPNITVSIGEPTLEIIVKNYCRESGVRNLEKHLEKIVRKVVFKAVNETEEQLAQNNATTESTNTATPASTATPDATTTNASANVNATTVPKIDFEFPNPLTFDISETNLEEYVGKPPYPNDAIYDSKEGGMPPGVVMGLAWNPLGGSPIFIEASAYPTPNASESSTGVHVVTGQLGNVMKESVNIAYTFARQFFLKRFPENDFFKKNQLHIHAPEGAVEKDGPSAGVAITTCLLSIATNVSVTPHVAMTGELSLTGKVLPVGGIKEKILAARRSGATTVILPAGNKRDADELPAYVKESIHIHFASTFEDAYKITLEERVAAAQQQASRKQE